VQYISSSLLFQLRPKFYMSKQYQCFAFAFWHKVIIFLSILAYGLSMLAWGPSILTWGKSICTYAWHLSLAYGIWFYLYYCSILSVFHSNDNKEINFPSKVIKFFDWFCKEVDEFLHSYGMKQNLDSKIPKSNEIIYIIIPFFPSKFCQLHFKDANLFRIDAVCKA